MSHHIELLFISCARIASAVAGIAFLYMAMFMYQDERGNQQNRLVNLWIMIKEKEEASLSSQAALIKYASQLASLGINRILGDRLLSLRTLSVSLSLSAASSMFIDTFAPGFHFPAKYIIPLGLIFLLYGFVVAPSLFGKGRKALAVLILLALGAGTFVAAVFVGGGVTKANFWVAIDQNGAMGVMIIAIALTFGISCDLALLAVNRQVIKLMATSIKSGPLLFGLVYNLCWCVFLADTLRLVLQIGPINSDPFLKSITNLENTGDFAQGLIVEGTILYAMSTNLFTLLISSSVLIVSAFALLHKLLWPVVGRFINAIYEWEIVTNKKVQLSFGIGCLVFALPQVAKLLKAFAL